MKPLDFEKVSIADARKAIDGPPTPVEKPDKGVKRSQQPSAQLLEATNAWIASLPCGVQPVELAQRFPRIANNIADLWRRVARCEEYLETLVVDGRGDRKGFPPNVAQELVKLRSYYAELHPGTQSTWDLVERGK